MLIYRWFKLFKYSKTIIQKHPEKNQLPKNNHPSTSCKSSNPGHPDSDKLKY
jgi:hypothetical protein